VDDYPASMAASVAAAAAAKEQDDKDDIKSNEHHTTTNNINGNSVINNVHDDRVNGKSSGGMINDHDIKVGAVAAVATADTHEFKHA
jgi:hypothetical protein